MSHFLIMGLHSLLVAVFFAFLTRDGLRPRLKVTLVLFAGMMAGALVLAWLMYPYPIQGRS
jgi:hypothetical protein